MKKNWKIKRKSSSSEKIENSDAEIVLPVSWVMADMRQILCGIRWMASVYNELKTRDPVLMMHIKKTLIEVRMTICNLNEADDDVRQTLIDLDHTLSVFHIKIFMIDGGLGNRYSLN